MESQRWRLCEDGDRGDHKPRTSWKHQKRGEARRLRIRAIRGCVAKQTHNSRLAARAALK